MSKLLGIAGQVAAELTKLRPGETWKVGESDDISRSARLQCGDDPDKYLSVKYDSETKKLNVGGHRVWKNGCFYPDFNSYPSDINVGAKKTPTVIARDINNRLIDDWMRAYDAGRAQLQHYDDVEAETCRLAERIATEFGGIYKDSRPHDIDFVLPGLHVDVSMASASSVRFECRSMPVDIARAVLAALVAAAPPKRCKTCDSLLNGRGECLNVTCDYHDMQQDAKFDKIEASKLVPDDLVKGVSDDSKWMFVSKVDLMDTKVKIELRGISREDRETRTIIIRANTKVKRYAHSKGGA